MSNNGSAQLVQKLWNYCNVLRDEGLSYGDYLRCSIKAEAFKKGRQ